MTEFQDETKMKQLIIELEIHSTSNQSLFKVSEADELNQGWKCLIGHAA